MALELLAGPFAVTNKLTAAAVGDSISGSPIWIDGRGLVLPIINEGVYVVQLDGAAYSVIDDRSLTYGLALIGTGSDPIGRRRWHGLADELGTFGEWDIDGVTLYKSDQFASDTPSPLGHNYARLHDRYIYPIGGRIDWKPLDLSAGWVAEASLAGLANAASLSWGTLRDEIIVGTSDGRVVRYDWVAKAFRGAIQTIGLTCKGIWWSALHGVYLSLHDVGSTLELRVWAATVRPASVSPPAPDATITAGLRTRITARVLGANSDPCEGEVVAWTLTGVGALTQAASYTDADGYAETYYQAPLDGASAAIDITAEVAI
ncbi:Ig-like domain-containing protein [Aromatoleum evansii]|uniref:Ig-like domain-containing protein n=1 Tax=Aromatoleum evansii TaxID=59406 RepID=A0ABZ1ASE9_AROEV|nr:Ig-like domain-containing protein [Aromatoleum evansii]WRL48365.1 Ig-like domain-containing protein [Aromatoleum evansii]